jgi:hypothetical protein
LVLFGLHFASYTHKHTRTLTLELMALVASFPGEDMLLFGGGEETDCSLLHELGGLLGTDPSVGACAGGSGASGALSDSLLEAAYVGTHSQAQAQAQALHELEAGQNGALDALDFGDDLLAHDDLQPSADLFADGGDGAATLESTSAPDHSAHSGVPTHGSPLQTFTDPTAHSPHCSTLMSSVPCATFPEAPEYEVTPYSSQAPAQHARTQQAAPMHRAHHTPLVVGVKRERLNGDECISPHSEQQQHTTAFSSSPPYNVSPLHYFGDTATATDAVMSTHAGEHVHSAHMQCGPDEQDASRHMGVQADAPDACTCEEASGSASVACDPRLGKELRELALQGVCGLPRDNLLQMSSTQYQAYMDTLKKHHKVDAEQRRLLSRQRRQIKNREYAQKSRKKAKVVRTTSSANVCSILDENARLRTENQELKEEVIRLRLLMHPEQALPHRHKSIAGCCAASSPTATVSAYISASVSSSLAASSSSSSPSSSWNPFSSSLGADGGLFASLSHLSSSSPFLSSSSSSLFASLSSSFTIGSSVLSRDLASMLPGNRRVGGTLMLAVLFSFGLFFGLLPSGPLSDQVGLQLNAGEAHNSRVLLHTSGDGADASQPSTPTSAILFYLLCAVILSLTLLTAVWTSASLRTRREERRRQTPLPVDAPLDDRSGEPALPVRRRKLACLV